LKIFPMKGYITVISRREDDTYRAEVVDIPGCQGAGPTVEDALAGAKADLRRRAESGGALPAPRPSVHMLSEVERRAAVGGACLCAGRAVA
jgi:predicted RNase H-like HicB family nuclease